jgi:hypothetical protein
MSSHLTDNRRHNLITASNAWSAIYDRKKLWRQMTLREAPFEGNEMTQWGIDHENDAISAFEKHMGDICIPGNELIVHRSLPFGASPDAYIMMGDNKIPVECKCPYTQELYKVTPERYWFQVQMQMLCCWQTLSYLVVWTPNELQVKKIHLSNNWIDFYIPLALEFLDYVERDVEPPRLKKKPTFYKT